MFDLIRTRADSSLTTINYKWIHYGVRMYHVHTYSTADRKQSSVTFLFILKRFAKAIKNTETWTGYLSLGFVFVFRCLSFFCHVFQFYLFHNLHVCYLFFLSLHVYFFVQIIHIFSCKYSHSAISYLKIKHNEHMYPVWDYVCFFCFVFIFCVFILWRATFDTNFNESSNVKISINIKLRFDKDWSSSFPFQSLISGGNVAEKRR